MADDKQKLVLAIRGLDCAEEVAVLKQAVGPLVGDEDRLSFDILNGRMTVDLQRNDITPAEIVAAVNRTGLKAEVWKAAASRQPAGFWSRHGRLVLTALSGLCSLAGFLTHAWQAGGIGAALGTEGLGRVEHPPALSILFYVLGIAAGLWHVGPKAWRALLDRRPDMNLLMSVAVVGAAGIGEWFEAATVAFLFSLSLLLESWSVGRARRAIAALLDLAPPFARIREETGEEREVPPGEVAVGQVFLVRPGEKIPLDGVVQEGTSAVNQAPITGESVPVTKTIGDEVFAGTINGEGLLAVECTKPAADTTLARIIRMVEEAHGRRSPSEQWVEIFARVYTPSVMLLALSMLLIPPLLFGDSWPEWLYRSLVLLVIACPCALVISTPVSIVAALASAARHGVLIKGGVYVEAPAHLKAIAMDKTGTLTAGEPRVKQVVPLNNHTEAELLERAAALEAHSNHPLAQAVVAAAKERGIAFTPAEKFEIIPGKGAGGLFDGRPFWLGSHRYLEERGQETPAVHQQLEELSRSGHTIVVVGQEQHVCGFIALADALRPGVKEVVRQLHRLGIPRVVMLTGDNEGTAQVIAQEAGIDEVRAELLPEDKVQAVEALVQEYKNVAMVGDGVNDAPALARANLGIAMGAAGSDAAIETADIALMSDDLTKLPWLIRHSRRTLAIVRQNITFALAVKAVFVVLTFAGYASLWAAIAADMGASLLVIFNGLRLLHGKQ